MVAQVETNIWQRLIDPAWHDLTPEAAQSILRLKFAQADIDKMNVLAALARDGTLTDSQKEEMDAYMRIGRMVAIMQSKARLAVKRSQER
jgi:uncharacterized protein YnzC (UPF0291/DUF896 family)